MDDQVIASLKKWPNIPECYGWLSLDRRGEWRMLNEYAQVNHLPGDVIHHTGLKDFIVRNYAKDELGQFFFQNGPQRVYISLAYTPWIVRLTPDSEKQWLIRTTFGHQVDPLRCFLDEHGQILIEAMYTAMQLNKNSPSGYDSIQVLSLGLLHDHDLEIFSNFSHVSSDACSFHGEMHWQSKKIPIEPILTKDLSKQYHFIKNPQAVD
jgi:hypothetical protein